MTGSQRNTAKLTAPQEALNRLLERLSPVDDEPVALAEAAGRVLAQTVIADRPSPACDVSAMDGYAVRLEDLKQGSLPVAGEVIMGQRPPSMLPGQAIRIFTGGAVPGEAGAVIRREDVRESPQQIDLPPELEMIPGQHIRREAENAPGGSTVLRGGERVTAPVAAVLANFGITQPRVSRRVRLSVIVTGSELLSAEDHPKPWQLRDSNAETLRALFNPIHWLAVEQVVRVEDEPAAIAHTLGKSLADCDAVVLTGGVSMGDHDYVPQAIEQAGGQIVFHKLAIRPGKPLLGAIGSKGKLIFALPGNPVSVMVTARRFALPTLRKLAGFAGVDPPVPTVELVDPGRKTLGLWWYRPVRLVAAGRAELVSTMGSGDLVGAAQSDGFIECPPNAEGPGPWPFYDWAGAETGIRW